MTVMEAWQDIVTALQSLKTEIPDLQVFRGRNSQATPPSLDVYPGDPFQIGAGFGVRAKRVFFTVRARISSADQDAQELIVRMLDPEDPASVESALVEADAAAVANDDGYVSGLRDELDGTLSCEWRVTVFL